jgi:hypothetical protein
MTIAFNRNRGKIARDQHRETTPARTALLPTTAISRELQKHMMSIAQFARYQPAAGGGRPV